MLPRNLQRYNGDLSFFENISQSYAAVVLKAVINILLGDKEPGALIEDTC